VAYQNYGFVPYFQNLIIINGSRSPYYEGVRWLWNEDYLWANSGKLNEV